MCAHHQVMIMLMSTHLLCYPPSLMLRKCVCDALAHIVRTRMDAHAASIQSKTIDCKDTHTHMQAVCGPAREARCVL